MEQAIIVADYGENTGMGHLMRCGALAKELSNSFEVCFVCEDDVHQETVRAVAERFGVSCRTVFGRLEAVPQMPMAVLIVDSYHITEALLARMAEHPCLKLVVDDNVLWRHYPADIILNQNIGAERLRYPAEEGTELLLGPRYAMLREDFRHVPTLAMDCPVTDVVVSMGGADLKNTTKKVLDFLKDAPEYRLHAVIAKGFTTAEELRRFAQDCPQIQLHRNPDMAALFSKCQCAVSACGSTVYELSAMGIPTLGIITADNQERMAQAAAAAGLMLLAGKDEALERQAFLADFHRVAADADLRREMQARQLETVSREGTKNIQAAIERRLARKADRTEG